MAVSELCGSLLLGSETNQSSSAETAARRRCGGHRVAGSGAAAWAVRRDGSGVSLALNSAQFFEDRGPRRRRDGCSVAVLERDESSGSAEEAAEAWCGGTNGSVLAAEAHPRGVTQGREREVRSRASSEAARSP